MKTSFLVKLTLVTDKGAWAYKVQIESKQLEKLYPIESYRGLGLTDVIQDAIRDHDLQTQYSPKAVTVDTFWLDDFTSVEHMQHKIPEHYEADAKARTEALMIPFI